MVVLQISKRVKLDEVVFARYSDRLASYQTDDGIIYYIKEFPSRLSVHWQDKEYVANTEDGECWGTIVHGNFLYFVIAQWMNNKDKDTAKIFKASFSQADGISISFVRDLFQDEIVNACGVNTRRTVRGEITSKCAYRLWENPETDGIKIDDKSDELTHTYLAGTNGGKVMFVNWFSSKNGPILNKIRDNIIKINALPRYQKNLEDWECNDYEKHPLLYANDTTPLIYITNYRKDIQVFDIRTLEFLAPIEISGVTCITSVIGICNGEITVHAEIEEILEEYTIYHPLLITAMIPQEYIADTAADNVVADIVANEEAQRQNRTVEQAENELAEMTQKYEEEKKRRSALEKKYRKALMMLGRQEDLGENRANEDA